MRVLFVRTFQVEQYYNQDMNDLLCPWPQKQLSF